MSANTLTNLIPTIYKAADIVSREMVGMIPAVTLHPGAEAIAKDQPVRFQIVPSMTSIDVTPAAATPDPAGQNIGSDTMTIDKSKAVLFPWTGEESLSIRDQYGKTLQDQFAQAFRTLTNEMESDLTALYVHASRAYGTAGTAPFGSTLADSAQALKILQDNGAPMSDLQMVLNTAGGAALRTLGQLTKANEAGNDDMLRRGVLLNQHGFAIRESVQFGLHTKGGGAGYLAAALEPIGETSLAVDTGTGTVLAGDILTAAGDTNKYVVGTALAGGIIGINENGLRQALPDTTALTVGNNYTPNMFFDRSAIHLLTRTPAMPEGGDLADDRILVTDPISGLTFSVAIYRQYHQVSYEVSIAWGVKAVKSEHIGLILG
jgi:hypothetical protein